MTGEVPESRSRVNQRVRRVARGSLARQPESPASGLRVARASARQSGEWPEGRSRVNQRVRRVARGSLARQPDSPASGLRAVFSLDQKDWRVAWGSLARRSERPARCPRAVCTSARKSGEVPVSRLHGDQNDRRGARESFARQPERSARCSMVASRALAYRAGEHRSVPRSASGCAVTACRPPPCRPTGDLGPTTSGNPPSLPARGPSPRRP